MDVAIRQMPERHAAAVAHRGPYPQIGQAFERIGRWASGKDLGEKDMIALYYDDPGVTPPEELRSDACVTVPDGFSISGDGVRQVIIPGGTFAVTTHIGPYSSIGQTWMEFLGEWFPKSGYAPTTGIGMEIYADDCATMPEDKLRTELCWPVKA